MGLLDSVEALQAGLDYTAARHNLLTANLAHADTPGYKPLDLERGQTFAGALHAALATTEAGHIGSASASPGGAPGGESWKVVEDASAQATGNDGNAVSLDREAVKIASNQLRYDALASLVQNELAGLEWAANDGK
jgi:flagellar basal-body rod protein FlgB